MNAMSSLSTDTISSAALPPYVSDRHETATDDQRQSSIRLPLNYALSAQDVVDLLAGLPPPESKKPWHFWAPRLALFAGLTGKQIALLNTDQLTFDDGRYWLTTSQGDDPRESPWPARSHPMHAELARLRFYAFANQRYFQEGRDVPLFPDLAGAKRPGDAIESWLRRSTRWLTRDGRHAPTLRDLRETCAQAALDGGASPKAVEAFMGLRVLLWDDRGPGEVDVAERIQAELMREAVDAVHYAGVSGVAEGPPASAFVRGIRRVEGAGSSVPSALH